MSRNTVNIIMSLILALNVLGLALTGLIMHFVLPPGSGPRTLWALRRHEWGSVHFWLAATFCTLLVVHVALHWQWVCSTVRRYVPGIRPAGAGGRGLARNLAGVALLLVLVAGLVGFVWVARTDVQGPPRRPRPAVRERTRTAATQPSRGERSGSRKPAKIRSSMTLGEAAAASGVPVEVLRQQLGVPQGVGQDERLNRLGRQYGFNIAQVRRIVAELTQEQKRT
jgi:hypothetical protein